MKFFSLCRWVEKACSYSPRGKNDRIRSNLWEACKSFESQTLATPATDWEAALGAQFEQSYKEKVYTLTVGAEKMHRAGVVPVFVMLPIDSINHNNTANRREAMNASLQALGILPSMDAKSSQ